MADDEIAGANDTRYLKQYRLGFAVTAMLLLAILVTLPFSLASIVDDVMGPATGKVFPLMHAHDKGGLRILRRPPRPR